LCRREALRAPPVRIGDQHQPRSDIRGGALSGNCQAACPSLTGDAGEAHLDEREAKRGRRSHRPLDGVLVGGVA